MSHLLEFYGAECPHCQKMGIVVDALVAEGLDFDRREVWHNEENMELLAKYDKDLCGGVPFFFNTKTEKFICGEATIDELRDWAKD